MVHISVLLGLLRLSNIYDWLQILTLFLIILSIFVFYMHK